MSGQKEIRDSKPRQMVLARLGQADSMAFPFGCGQDISQRARDISMREQQAESQEMRTERDRNDTTYILGLVQLVLV